MCTHMDTCVHWNMCAHMDVCAQCMRVRRCVRVKTYLHVRVSTQTFVRVWNHARECTHMWAHTFSRACRSLARRTMCVKSVSPSTGPSWQRWEPCRSDTGPTSATARVTVHAHVPSAHTRMRTQRPADPQPPQKAGGGGDITVGNLHSNPVTHTRTRAHTQPPRNRTQWKGTQ